SRSLSATHRLLDGEADGVRLRDHVLRLLIGDQDAGLLQLEAAGEVLQSEERLADAAAAADQINLVRQQAARAVIEEIDAADDAVAGRRGRGGCSRWWFGNAVDGEWRVCLGARG